MQSTSPGIGEAYMQSAKATRNTKKERKGLPEKKNPRVNYQKKQGGRHHKTKNATNCARQKSIGRYQVCIRKILRRQCFSGT